MDWNSKKINLSINPVYLCNFRCNFCYLTEKQLSDKKILGLDILEKKLIELKENKYYIDHVDLYGGEIGLLPEHYLYSLDHLLEKYDNPSINIITNFSKINRYFLEDHVDISVSFDFEAREKHESVIQNIIKFKKDISILMLASPKLLELDVDYMIKIFNSISNIKTVEIKPYSQNQANRLSVSDLDFEDFVKKWISSNVDKNFQFTNLQNIKKSLNKNYNAFSDNHLYITPSGKFAVLEFDKDNREYFLDLSNLKDYEDWCLKEKNRVNENEFCKKCEYLGNCLTEHYRDVKSLEKSCNGFKKMLDWAKDQKL
jgi:sulfatase maturation enzyme AslB (radical SAM superfamily)